MNEVIVIDLTGMVLKDRYCILEQIGKGGGGRVYLARDMELGVHWAVKELPVSGKREARLMLTLEHHSLPKMVDYIEKDQYCYIVMEYINGENLKRILDRQGSLDVEKTVKYGISLAEVLGYLHGRKPPVFYGDMKPDNLMVSASGKLYLIDLGSAVIGYSREQNLCMGTEGFAAPEQYQGRIGRTTDVYGLGKTLETFLGGNSFRIIMKNPELFSVLRKCCFRNEKLRYQDMETLGKALRRVQKNAGKYKAVRALAAGGICLVLILASGAAVLRRENKVDFYGELTRATALYYSEDFREGSEKQREEICEAAETQLKRLMEQCRTPEEQETVSEILKANRAVMESEKNGEKDQIKSQMQDQTETEAQPEKYRD